MFTGIGGFELGIERAALSFRNRATQNRESETFKQGVESTPEGIQPNGDKPNHIESGDPGQVLCVGYSEIDKAAIKTYEEHYDHRNYGDATTINAVELPDFDLLVGGFPCQAFSVAGKRGGFDDTRGTLFFDVARILAEKRPRHLVLENVKGLLSHDNGKTFTTILGVLTDLGYFVEWQVLNSKDFGVPQNRERVFIVGHLGGEPTRKVFPIISSNRTIIEQVNNPRHSNNRLFDTEGVSPTLNTMQGGNRQPKVIAHQFNRKEGVGKEVDITGTLSSSDWRGLNRNQNQTAIVSESRIRRLTPIECERLQGFPDNWTTGADTQRYKQCGNAVTVNVVQAVISGLIDTF